MWGMYEYAHDILSWNDCLCCKAKSERLENTFKKYYHMECMDIDLKSGQTLCNEMKMKK